MRLPADDILLFESIAELLAPSSGKGNTGSFDKRSEEFFFLQVRCLPGEAYGEYDANNLATIPRHSPLPGVLCARLYRLDSSSARWALTARWGCRPEMPDPPPGTELKPGMMLQLENGQVRCSPLPCLAGPGWQMLGVLGEVLGRRVAVCSCAWRGIARIQEERQCCRLGHRWPW
jgi:hypothetical protein